MKKLVFLYFTLMIGAMVVSCNSTSSANTDKDSIDTVQVDSLDTASIDTTMC